MKRFPIFYGLIFLFFVTAKGYSLATLNDIRTCTHKKFTRVTFQFSNLPPFSYKKRKRDNSLILKVSRTYLNCHVPVFEDKRIKLIGVKKISSDLIFTFLMKGDLVFKVFTLKSPPRLVLDFLDQKRPDKKEIDEKDIIWKKTVIVIDPGHGGKDPGAIGKGGVMEKDIVLKEAFFLKKEIEKSIPNSLVYLTRKRDKFLSLQERAEFANRVGADIFVSIHANSNRKRSVCGIETYFLNMTDDPEALAVAARENGISINEMGKVSKLLTELILNHKINDSSLLAGFIQKNMVAKVKSHFKGVRNLGVKEAPFYVLLGTKMAACLVELSFLSNPKEERRLRNPFYLKLLAKGIALGIKEYILKAHIEKIL